MVLEKNYISWDEYFMGIAILSSKRSKDPSTKVGACIVSQDNKVLSLGYNGMPIGVDDNLIPWEREGKELETKYPCNECAKAIIQAGIKEVIYLSDKYENTNSTIASKKMLNMAGIKLTKYHGKILVPEFVGDKENV